MITDMILRNEREIYAMKATQEIPAKTLSLNTYTKTFTLVQYNDDYTHQAFLTFKTKDGSVPVICWGVTASENNVDWQPANKIYNKPYVSFDLFDNTNTDEAYLSVDFSFPYGSSASSASITFTVQVTATTEGDLSVEIS